MVDRAPDSARYRAFLSYSHKDSVVAGKLHRRLETYRLPKRLVGTETPRGPVPERLAPIFRDRDEFPAATDLSEEVRAALAESGALIILCSPAAAESNWVGQEIETFRALHPDRPILAAIVDGEPGECFPESLRTSGPGGTRVEPLATDLRPEGDGRHLGLLKLVAGVTGVGLDAMVQRDAARRIRRVTAVTAVAVAAMLIMAALTAIALDARAEAESQRAEVGRQIEFMLTDLRERHRGVGRLDIQLAVNRHALDYYSRQDLAELDPDSLERYARALLAIGEDDLVLGDLGAASAAFREAHRTTEEQLTRAPREPRRIYAHAQSQYWIGHVHELRGQWSEAMRYYRHYAAAAEKLVAIAPQKPEYSMEMGFAAINLGKAQLNGQGDLAAAQMSFEKGLRWFERVERARPGDAVAQREQADAYAWLADVSYARKRFPDSLAARVRQHEILFRLRRADPADMDRLYQLALAQRAVGRLAVQVGQLARAAPYYRDAHENAIVLYRHDPSNANWLFLKASVECDLLFSPRELRRPETDEHLRRGLAAAVAKLSARRDPNASPISRCLAGYESRRRLRSA